MRNTFRYALTVQDYIYFERMNMKRAFRSSIVMIVMFLGLGVFLYITEKNLTILISFVIGSIVILLAHIYSYYVSASKKANNYVKKDNSYLKLTEITITDKTIETNNLPNENEAGMVAVYPYSIMNAIYETNEYFYFLIGNEAKILPKSAVPDEMKELVFKEIKKNPNCVFIK